MSHSLFGNSFNPFLMLLGGHRFYRLFILSSVLVLVLAALLLWRQDTSLGAFRAALSYQFCSPPASQSHQLNSDLPQRRKHAVLATHFGFHHDVTFALAWTLERVIKDNGLLSVYSPTPLGWRFQDVVNELDLYHGPINSYENLITDLLENSGDGAADIVILGTCEIDLRDWRDELLAAWEARDDAHKFQLVCMVHNVEDTYWQNVIPEWSRRNSFRVLTISEHVSKAFHTYYQDLARSSDPRFYTAGYEHIPIDSHSHVLDIRNLPDLSPTRMLSNVVIQGFLNPDSRDYMRIFEMLTQFLHEDPAAWGYLPLGNRSSFATDESLPHPPFRLHLAGAGSLDIPPELAEVVITYGDLDYNQYYQIIGSMDLCVPAFTATDDRYFARQASSTVGMCLECNTPLLATWRIREAYTDINDDRVVVTRPSAMLEMDVIKAFRTGDPSSFLDSDPAQTGWKMGSHPHIREAVEKMMREGWVRPNKGFMEVKRNLWSRNDQVIWRLLRDL